MTKVRRRRRRRRRQRRRARANAAGRRTASLSGDALAVERRVGVRRFGRLRTLAGSRERGVVVPGAAASSERSSALFFFFALERRRIRVRSRLGRQPLPPPLFFCSCILSAATTRARARLHSCPLATLPPCHAHRPARRFFLPLAVGHFFARRRQQSLRSLTAAAVTTIGCLDLLLVALRNVERATRRVWAGRRQAGEQPNERVTHRLSPPPPPSAVCRLSPLSQVWPVVAVRRGRPTFICHSCRPLTSRAFWLAAGGYGTQKARGRLSARFCVLLASSAQFMFFAL